MVLRFFLLASIFFFIFCSVPERDSPCDPDGINYQEPENGEQHILTYVPRLMENGKQVEGAEVLLIDFFEGESNSRVIWGKATSNTATYDLKDEYGRTAAQVQDAVAGKWVPVYISAGNWNDDALTSFEINDEDGPGTYYTLSVDRIGLTIAKTKGREQIGIMSAHGILPATGIDTLWVKADYDIGDVEFTLNVAARAPAMTLRIKQPRLEFRESAADNAAVTTPSGYSKWEVNGKPPVVGNPLDVYIVAIDPVTNGICDQCSFSLTQRSEAVGTCKDGIANPIVRGDKLTIENGKLNTNMRGQDDTGAEGCTATWKITGYSPETTVQWTGLRFRESPVPVPMENYIYDRNGDGIGDSVVVKFNKSLLNTGKGDSLLPFLLEINWDGTPVYFHHPNYTPEQLKNSDYVRSLYKNPSYLAANRQYWNNFLKDGVTIVIANNDTRFSEKIKTSGTGKVTAWIPYIDTECPRDCSVDNVFTYSGSTNDLRDRIPPIVTRAEYVYDSNNKSGCYSGANGCKETFTVYLSEPIFAGPEATAELALSPFAYCLGRSRGPSSCPVTKISQTDRESQTYDNLDWAWEHPNSESYAYSALYKPNTKPIPASAGKGDSIVELIYYAGSATRSPKADDWVKLRNDAKVFQDAEGNTFSPRERGVLITGVEKKYGCRIQ